MVAIAMAPACARRGSTTTHVDRSVITHDQLAAHKFTNAYEAVEALHSNWLITKGADSFSTPGAVRVYLDNTNLGGVDKLRDITMEAVQFIRYFDGVTATARWGLDHGNGVILVSTHPVVSP